MKRSAILAAAALGAAGASFVAATIANAGSTSSKTPTTPTAARHGSFFGAGPAAVGTVKSVATSSFTMTTGDNMTVTVAAQ